MNLKVAFLLGSSIAFAILLTVGTATLKLNNVQKPKGRIKAFDDVLRMYGKQIHNGEDLKYAIEEAKRLAQSPEYNPEFANYYLEILELLQSNRNAKIIQQENHRLNIMITSASNQRGAEDEIEYAVIRRNILGAFTDSAAEYVMHGMFHSLEGELDAINPNPRLRTEI